MRFAYNILLSITLCLCVVGNVLAQDLRLQSSIQTSGQSSSFSKNQFTKLLTDIGSGISSRVNLEELKFEFKQNLLELLSNTFFLESFRFNGNNIIGNSDIIKAAGLEQGFWLWDLDLVQIKEKISQLSWVKSVNVGVSIFPSKLNLSVSEHEPFLLAEVSKRLWVVSSSGALISPIAEIKNMSTIKKLRALPRLKGVSDDNNKTDQTYLSSENARYHHAVKSLKFLLNEKNFPYRIGIVKTLKDGSLRLSSANKNRNYPDIIVNIRSEENALEIIKSIEKILRDLENRSEVAELIDMRFSGKGIVR